MIPTGRRSREIGLAILQGRIPSQKSIEQEFRVGGSKAALMLDDFARAGEQIARELLNAIGPLGPEKNREHR